MVPYEKGDILLWIDSSSGLISFAGAYELYRSKGGNFSGVARLWTFVIPPKRFILLHLALHNQLPTEDNLRKCGMVMVSRCNMYNKAFETV